MMKMRIESFVMLGGRLRGPIFVCVVGDTELNDESLVEQE